MGVEICCFLPVIGAVRAFVVAGDFFFSEALAGAPRSEFFAVRIFSIFDSDNCKAAVCRLTAVAISDWSKAGGAFGSASTAAVVAIALDS
mgnify:FL=1